MATKRAALIVIDGWGEREEEYGNAIKQAATPVMDAFKTDANFAVIEAAGLAVGLPPNTMGNSEVGHLTVGAGAVDYQDLVRINQSVSDGSIAKQKGIVDAFESAKSGTGRLHLFGLLSDGGVHSHQEHLYAIIAAAKEAGVKRTLLHVCMDGRDTPPTSGAGYMEALEKKLAEIGHGEISTISGRYYAMDRDKRWERVQKAYDVMCRKDGECETVAAGGVKAVVEGFYAKEKPINDEFIEPTGTLADGGIADGDVFFCFNFRADRAREIFECISIAPKFETAVARKPAVCLQMTRYNSTFESPMVFPPQQLTNGLCETVSKLGLTQFHVAETEKYAHVTFFFNGGREDPFEGEVREMKESPKVATYDLEPKMAAEPVADAMVREIEAGTHALLICNLAPPDMVGHTGFMDKAMEAAAHTDMCVGKIRDACVKAGVGLFILADHGNCETMLTPDGKPITSHSTTPVPFVAALPSDCDKKFSRKDGGVADVAPTMLTFMGIEVPKEMTGKSFI